MDIDIVIIGIIVIAIGILAIKIKNPQKFEELKESLKNYWENLRTYFNK